MLYQSHLLNDKETKLNQSDVNMEPNENGMGRSNEFRTLTQTRVINFSDRICDIRNEKKVVLNPG